ncbi:hypothetical protein GTY65_40620 [Streptomyces sp. SID8379]|nr:hypothetical protein [Streptomyces sp. SID8379]
MGVAVVAAALAVSGCSGSHSSGKHKSRKSSGHSSGRTSGGTASSGTGTGSAKNVDGIWSATTDGRPVVLVIASQQASLSTGDGHLCTGTVSGASRKTLSLRCADGNTDRTMGTIRSSSGTTMRVSWDAGANDTFKKSTDGNLPGGLPTGLPSGLPSDLPTDLPSDLPTG